MQWVVQGASLHLISSICWGDLSWFATALKTATLHCLNAQPASERGRLKRKGGGFCCRGGGRLVAGGINRKTGEEVRRWKEKKCSERKEGEVRWVWIKNLHQPGLHGGSLHSWQTGWWRGVRVGWGGVGGLCMREMGRGDEKKKREKDRDTQR